MASTEAQRGGLRIVSSLEFQARPRGGAWSRLLGVTAHPLALAALREMLAIAVLLGIIAAVFWPLIIGVGVYAESDTFTYFYPVFALLHASVRAGELPLWTPYVFGGFPLFAEGQIGALYPPGLLAAQL